LELPIRITKYLGDDPQPGICECAFVDADNRTHVIVDKVLIFVNRLLSEQDSYPIAASIPCQVLDAWTDATGKELARIKVEWVESTEGVSEFVVLKKQLL